MKTAILLVGLGALIASGFVTVRAAPATSSQADSIAALRSRGQAGLDTVMAANAALIGRMRSGVMPLDDPRVAELRTTIDEVAKQRDAYASGLYWYTDFDAAKAEAKRTGRHILSLRLLGNLDEEYSCANSRFFRTVLYANTEVSKHLREHYVLHWKSVRPAPLVTIDMGDGRRIKRTITGNSIHYVLDADGTVLDAIPGLYGPEAFLTALERSETLTGADDKALAAWNANEADALRRRWVFDAVQTGMYGENTYTRLILRNGESAILRWMISGAFPPSAAPTESDAGQPAGSAPRKPTEFEPTAIAKSMVERPISRQTAQSKGSAGQEPESRDVPPPDSFGQPLEPRMTNAWWEKFAALGLDVAHLDESSREMMMAKLPRDSVKADERESGGADENTPFARTLDRFETAIAQDTARNEFLFHARIHQWLADDKTGQLRHDVEALNKRVYAELFLTPDYDAWLGLVPDDTYTALEKDGCACDKGAPPMRGN